MSKTSLWGCYPIRPKPQKSIHVVGGVPATHKWSPDSEAPDPGSTARCAGRFHSHARHPWFPVSGAPSGQAFLEAGQALNLPYSLLLYYHMSMPQELWHVHMEGLGAAGGLDALPNASNVGRNDGFR